MAKSYLKVSGPGLAKLEQTVAAIADIRILVGVPHETAKRDSKEPLSNAEIAYIQNFGAPEANIPAREFMEPGVRSVLPEIIIRLKAAAQAGINGDLEKHKNKLIAIGLLVQNAIKLKIQSNIPPPLAEMTVAKRIARRKSATWRSKRKAQVDANLAAGLPPGAGLFTALIDTGKLINSITFVLRSTKQGGKDIMVGPHK